MTYDQVSTIASGLIDRCRSTNTSITACWTRQRLKRNDDFMNWKVRTIFLVNNPALRVEDLNRGDIPQPMLIKTDSHGEKQITKLDASKAITIGRIKDIQSLHQVADLA